MLFLRALLCSLLATSTLAIPVPLGENSEASTEVHANGANGLWFKMIESDLETVSKPHSFDLVQYQISIESTL